MLFQLAPKHQLKQSKLYKKFQKAKNKTTKKRPKKMRKQLVVSSYLFHKNFRIKDTSGITNANLKRNATANVTHFIHPDAELFVLRIISKYFEMYKRKPLFTISEGLLLAH